MTHSQPETSVLEVQLMSEKSSIVAAAVVAAAVVLAVVEMGLKEL